MNVNEKGYVVQASKNVESIFGYKIKLIEGLSISKLLPVSMREEHDRLLLNWVHTGSWTNFGVTRDIYAFNKNQTCFSCKAYLKIIQRKDDINIIATIFEENKSDFMIVNSEGIIDGAG